MNTTEGLRIVAYESDAEAIKDRYLHLTSENDLRIIYLTSDPDNAESDLQMFDIPSEVVTVIDRSHLIELEFRMKPPEETGIPFPQDVDKYFVGDSLGFHGERPAFISVAEQLPHDRVTIVSLDSRVLYTARELGYSVQAD